MEKAINKKRARKSGLMKPKRTFLQVERDEEMNGRLKRLKTLTGLITESEITRLALSELENKYTNA